MNALDDMASNMSWKDQSVSTQLGGTINHIDKECEWKTVMNRRNEKKDAQVGMTRREIEYV